MDRETRKILLITVGVTLAVILTVFIFGFMAGAEEASPHKFKELAGKHHSSIHIQ